ncbi:MAG: rod shape-determining protein MreC [Lachnospiraceae bacterium]|nr:rod shape-determining protein MreC [Lachnospiraceae bacterium]
MRRKQHDKATSRTLIMILSLICLALIGASLLDPAVTGPVHTLAGFVVTPVAKGIDSFGRIISNLSENLTDSATIRSENESLKAQVDTLTAENSQLLLDREELERLRELHGLAEEYADYPTIGAHVISKDSGNWFSTFTIDKGRNDGVQVNCNVIGQAGLVGIVTQTGPDWAIVRSIIDDNSNVSAMVSTTSDTCIIAGNLELIDQGSLSLVKLRDDTNHVHVGDKVVTSNISEKFLPGILIGYISELGNDANNLTKSGQITPVVDFRHIQEVLVITELKRYIASPEGGSAQAPVNDVDTAEGETE